MLLSRRASELSHRLQRKTAGQGVACVRLCAGQGSTFERKQGEGVQSGEGVWHGAQRALRQHELLQAPHASQRPKRGLLLCGGAACGGASRSGGCTICWVRPGAGPRGRGWGLPPSGQLATSPLPSRYVAAVPSLRLRRRERREKLAGSSSQPAVLGSPSPTLDKRGGGPGPHQQCRVCRSTVAAQVTPCSASQPAADVLTAAWSVGGALTSSAGDASSPSDNRWLLTLPRIPSALAAYPFPPYTLSPAPLPLTGPQAAQ